MKLSSDQEIEHLEEKIRVLEAENASLAEFEENIFILSQVGDLLSTCNESDTLIQAVLERVSLVKNIPLTLYLLNKENRLFVQNLYYLKSDLNCTKVEIKIPTRLQKEPRCFGDEMASFSKIQLTGVADFIPRSVILMPQNDKPEEKSMLVFVDDLRNHKEFGKLMPTIQQIADITFRRLDGLVLQKKLKQVNMLLEETVGLQTADLLRTNERLKEKEADYRLLFDSSPDAIFIHPASGKDFRKFIDVNQVACERYGYTHDEFLTLNAVDISDPSSHPHQEFEQYRDQTRHLNRNTFETCHYTKAGKKFLVEVSSTVLSFRGKQAILSIARDISEREKMRQKIKDQFELTQQIFQTTLNGYILGDADGGLLDVNKAYCKMIGYSRDELLKMSIYDLEQNLTPEQAKLLAKQIFKNGSARFEIRHAHKDGHLIDLDVSVVSIKREAEHLVAAFVQDVTESKLQKTRLEESEANLNSMINSREESFWSIDHNNEYITFNSIFAKAYKNTYGLELKKGMNAYQGLPAEVKKFWQPKYKKAQAGNKLAFEFTANIETNPHIFQIVLNPIYMNNKVKGVSASSTDITDKRKIELALKETEERFRIAFFTNPDAITITRLEDGLYVDVNQGFVDMSGYKREEVVGLSALDINIWHDLKDRKKLVKGLKKSGTVENIEAVFQKKDGQLLHGLMSASIMLLNQVPHILLMVRNIENLKRLELEREALFAESERARKLLYDVFARVEDGVVALDNNWRYTYLNDRAAILLNRKSPNDLLGKEIWKEFPGGKDEKLYKAYHKAMDTQQVVYLRDYFTPGKRWFENRIYPSSDGLTIYFTDITNQKTAEEEVRKLSLAVEQSPAAVIITSTDGTVEYTNPFFIKMSGYTSDEVRAQNISILKSKSQPIEDNDLLWQTISSGKIWEGEFENTKKDGSPYWVRASVSPLFNEEGEISHYLSIQEDITEKKKLENQFHQFQKMEAIGHLAGGVAHDFNNLLTIINGYSEIALMKLTSGDPYFDSFQQIQEAGVRASTLTRQLLAFSRKQIMKTEIIDLTKLVQNMENMLRRLISEDITIVTELDKKLGMIKADRGQIEQVILNLVVNARDAIIDGGVLTIETRNIDLLPEFVRMHKDAKQGAYVLLSVSDTGIGMTEKIKENIFDPFFTTKERGRGTGLGLSTVYGIVKQSGGTVWVYSEPGMGTTFNIYLPLVKSANQELEKPVQLQDDIHGTETILVVEDEDGVRNLAAQGLIEFGYTILLASNSKDALKLMKKNHDNVQLLLTDVIMPGESGVKLAEKLIKQNPNLKVLFMSGYTNENITHQGILNEGINFIQKPFSLNNLLKKVRDVLDLKN